ncbi:MAG TPA: LPS export ABC transporter ATP-binding protein [Longimicrobiales bacterium]|nr:LPS export ABC transporter ATP-binding protein [Longimicrobiales bacterium]
MTTRKAMGTFLEKLTAHDLTMTVGLQELVHRADGEGRAERGVWIASLRDELQELAHELGSHGASMLGAEGEALVHFVEARVIPPLEAAGLARRDGPGEAWTAMEIDAELWSELSTDREGVAEELARTVRRVEGERAGAFRTESTVAPHMGEGSRLYAEGLTKIYRRRKVVSEVDISVNQGEIVGLLGPNGAGKTTTFYMMVGLIPPNAGEVYLDGEDLTDVPMFKRARKGMGYLAQEPSIFRKLSVEENVLAILETLNLSRAEEKELLEHLLNELGLQTLRSNKAYSLSGGERRRLEITRALVQRPKFMLLDEPFAGIDPIAVNDIQQIVRGLKSRGIGVIISDHNVEQTLEIVDRAYIMYEGRIRVSGTVSELVWNEEVAEIYLGPSLTQRMRNRYPRPTSTEAASAVQG